MTHIAAKSICLYVGIDEMGFTKNNRIIIKKVVGIFIFIHILVQHKSFLGSELF
jgi:hypothetical protein